MATRKRSGRTTPKGTKNPKRKTTAKPGPDVPTSQDRPPIRVEEGRQVHRLGGASDQPQPREPCERRTGFDTDPVRGRE